MMLDQKQGLAESSLPENKFMALLQRNREKHLQRKKKVDEKIQIRHTKSLATNNYIPKIMVEKKRKIQESDVEKISRAFCRSEFPDPKELAELKGIRLRFEANCKVITEKINGRPKESRLHHSRRLTTPKIKSGHIRTPSFNIRSVASNRNFCDFYSFAKRGAVDDEYTPGGRQARPYLNPSGNQAKAGKENHGGRKKATLKSVRSNSACDFDDSQAPRLSARANRIRSVLLKKNFNPNLLDSSRFSVKINPNDSEFLSKYFKLKGGLCDKNSDSLWVDKDLVNELNSLIQTKYKSYWMTSIEDLLAQNVISDITYGYYKYKSINFGPFKLMSHVEKMIYKLQEDITRESMFLFNHQLNSKAN